MRINQTIGAAVVAIAAFVAVAPAAAQPTRRETEARSVFEAGQTAFDDARYEDALAHFKRAHELSQRAELLFNIALCEDRLRDDAAAITAYEAYLAASPDADNREEVAGRLAALRQARQRRLAILPENVARESALPGQESLAPVKSTPVYETWWFWTVIGVAVTGAIIGIAIAASGGDEPLQRGDVGGVVFTLGGSR